MVVTLQFYNLEGFGMVASISALQEPLKMPVGCKVCSLRFFQRTELGIEEVAEYRTLLALGGKKFHLELSHMPKLYTKMPKTKESIFFLFSDNCPAADLYVDVELAKLHVSSYDKVQVCGEDEPILCSDNEVIAIRANYRSDVLNIEFGKFVKEYGREHRPLLDEYHACLKSLEQCKTEKEYRVVIQQIDTVIAKMKDLRLWWIAYSVDEYLELS